MNRKQIGKWMMGLTTALVVTTGAYAREIMLVEEGRKPDPYQVAAIFGHKAEPTIKYRGIRVLSGAGSVAGAQLARKADCPQIQAEDGPRLKVRGVRLPTDSRPPAKPLVQVEQAADCTPDLAPAAPATAGSLKPESIALMLQFAFNSSQIAEEALPELDAMAEGIKMAGNDVKIIIEGHTDALGSDQYNLILSYMRATAVKNYLVREHGIDARNLKPVGMGKRAPLNAANPHAPENRRVEFRLAQG